MIGRVAGGEFLVSAGDKVQQPRPIRHGTPPQTIARDREGFRTISHLPRQIRLPVKQHRYVGGQRRNL